MNPQIIMQMLMSKIQQSNPQMSEMIQGAIQSGQDPKQLLSQVMKQNNINPSQMQGIMQQAKQMGVPDNVLSMLQNNKLG